MSDVNSKTATVAKVRKLLRSALTLVAVSSAFACGGRIGKNVSPVGVAVVLYPTSQDQVKPVSDVYPHVALQIMSGGRYLSFDEDFELVLTKDFEGKNLIARYKSSELASAAKDTICASETSSIAGETTAVFCANAIQMAQASAFLLVRSDGSIKAASSYSSEELDSFLGVRHLSLSF